MFGNRGETTKSKEQPHEALSVGSCLRHGFCHSRFAEQFYVAFDPASHKCTMMHSQPAAPMKSMGGPFKTEAEAHKAMAGMKECEG